MPYLNIDYGLLIFEDKNNSKNPDIRLPDISRQIHQVPVDFDKSERTSIYTNEIKDILTTQRTLGWDNTTQIEFARPISSEDYFRITYTGTGTAPGFRTNRNMGGDATTEVTISRVTNYVARIQNTAGTAWTLGSIQVNDIIKFDKDTDSVTSPFSASNKGKEYIVQATGADYIDFIDNGSIILEAGVLLGANYDDVLRVIAQSPVKKGDTIQIEGSGINPSNHGRFEVVDVSSDFIEVINPLGYAQTVLYGTNTLVVYEYLIGFIHLRASGPIKIRCGGQTEWVRLSRIGAEVLHISSTETHKVQALNDSPDTVTISVQHAMVLG